MCHIGVQRNVVTNEIAGFGGLSGLFFLGYLE
jgi:hypothetical protein